MDIFISYLCTASASVGFYILIIICFKVSNIRSLSDIKLPDFVLLIIIGEAIGSIIPGDDHQIQHALICVLSLFMANRIIDKLIYKYKWFDRWVEGVPIVLIHGSKIIKENLKKGNLTEKDLIDYLRTQGISSEDEVATAILETGGTISIIPKK